MWFDRRSPWPEGAAGLSQVAEGGQLVFETNAETGQALRALARRRGESPEALAAALLLRGLEREARRAEVEVVLAALTPRERQVAWRAARGQTNRQIAQALVISPETVKTHVARVLEKLEVRSKAELRILLLDLGVGWWEENGTTG